MSGVCVCAIPCHFPQQVDNREGTTSSLIMFECFKGQPWNELPTSHSFFFLFSRIEPSLSLILLASHHLHQKESEKQLDPKSDDAMFASAALPGEDCHDCSFAPFSKNAPSSSCSMK